MGRGRPRKSTALKVAEGNAGKRTRVNNSPKPAAGVPLMPANVKACKVAREKWDWVVSQLAAMNMLSATDALAIEFLCLDYSELQVALADLKKNGINLKGPNGGKYLNPASGVANSAKKRIKEFMLELGLTPKAREQIAAVSVSTEKERSGLAGYRNRNPSKKN